METNSALRAVKFCCRVCVSCSTLAISTKSSSDAKIFLKTDFDAEFFAQSIGFSRKLI